MSCDVACACPHHWRGLLLSRDVCAICVCAKFVLSCHGCVIVVMSVLSVHSSVGLYMSPDQGN